MKTFKLVLLAFFYSTSAIAGSSHHYMSTSIGGGSGIFGSMFSFSTGGRSHNPPPVSCPDLDYMKQSVNGSHLSAEQSLVMSSKYRLDDLQDLNQYYATQMKRETREIKNYRNHDEQSFDDRESGQERYTERMRDPDFVQRSQEAFIQRVDEYSSTHRYSHQVMDARLAHSYSKSNLGFGYVQDAVFYLEIARDLFDVATSVAPGISLGRDTYEAYYGKNLITGETLSDFDRAIAVVGVVTAGNSNIGMKGIRSINKMVGVNLPKEVVTISQELIDKYGIKGYKEIVNLLKKNTPFMNHEKFNQRRRAVLSAFEKPVTFVKESVQGFTLYRYINAKDLKYTDQGAHWFTTQKYDSIAELAEKMALKHPHPDMLRTEFETFKGSAYMKGGVAPKFERAGGGEQYYFFDKTKTQFKKGSEVKMDP